MRLSSLRRVWAPLPVSALALSSMRGVTKRSGGGAAAASRGGISCHRRSSIGIPAWKSSRAGVVRGGGVSAGVGASVLGELFAGGSSANEVPLVQLIYDELRKMEDPEKEAEKGADSTVVEKVLQLMDKLEPGDLGISEDDFQGLTHPLCVPVVGGADAKGFEMTMFMLPKGGGIPLHDHPQMAVLSRILFGSLDVDSYDVVSDETRNPSPANTPATETTGRRRQAVLRQRRTVRSGTPSFLLTPSAGNVHAFRAPCTCAVFDVLIPPYDNARGRKCSYFQLETPSVDGRKQEDVVESDTQDANSSGDEERRIVLKDVPEPRGLPTWSTYFGPRVIV